MSDVLLDEQNLYDIADAIREKLEVQTEYLPSEMEAAIRSIPTGGGGTSADDVSYDNASSGLTASDVQAAIDETVEDIENKHTVTSFEVTTANWTTDTTSQSGTTLYKKQISLNHVYANPSVDIGSASGSVLPTTAQQEAYDLIQYCTVDTTVPCLYLYASDIPTDGFYINVEGVD